MAGVCIAVLYFCRPFCVPIAAKLLPNNIQRPRRDGEWTTCPARGRVHALLPLLAALGMVLHERHWRGTDHRRAGRRSSGFAFRPSCPPAQRLQRRAKGLVIRSPNSTQRWTSPVSPLLVDSDASHQNGPQPLTSPLKTRYAHATHAPSYLFWNHDATDFDFCHLPVCAGPPDRSMTSRETKVPKRIVPHGTTVCTPSHDPCWTRKQRVRAPRNPTNPTQPCHPARARHYSKQQTANRHRSSTWGTVWCI